MVGNFEGFKAPEADNLKSKLRKAIAEDIKPEDWEKRREALREGARLASEEAHAEELKALKKLVFGEGKLAALNEKYASSDEKFDKVHENFDRQYLDYEAFISKSEVWKKDFIEGFKSGEFEGLTYQEYVEDQIEQEQEAVMRAYIDDGAQDLAISLYGDQDEMSPVDLLEKQTDISNKTAEFFLEGETRELLEQMDDENATVTQDDLRGRFMKEVFGSELSSLNEDEKYEIEGYFNELCTHFRMWNESNRAVTPELIAELINMEQQGVSEAEWNAMIESWMEKFYADEEEEEEEKKEEVTYDDYLETGGIEPEEIDVDEMIDDPNLIVKRLPNGSFEVDYRINGWKTVFEPVFVKDKEGNVVRKFKMLDPLRDKDNVYIDPSDINASLASVHLDKVMRHAQRYGDNVGPDIGRFMDDEKMNYVASKIFLRDRSLDYLKTSRRKDFEIFGKLMTVISNQVNTEQKNNAEWGNLRDFRMRVNVIMDLVDRNGAPEALKNALTNYQEDDLRKITLTNLLNQTGLTPTRGNVTRQ